MGGSPQEAGGFCCFKAKIKIMSVSGNMLKKIRVGRSEKYFIFSFYFEIVYIFVNGKNVVLTCYISAVEIRRTCQTIRHFL